MPYTKEDGGRLNNFALEPKVYQSKPATNAQKRNYLIVGVAGIVLVVGLVVVAVYASGAS